MCAEADGSDMAHCAHWPLACYKNLGCQPVRSLEAPPLNRTCRLELSIMHRVYREC